MSAIRLFSIDDLANLPRPQWLIEDLFEANSLVMLAGAPGSFKSFLVLDWLLCMVTHRPWNGKAVKPAKVLYVLGEGKLSLFKRIHAWGHHNNCTQLDYKRLQDNFRVSFDVPQLGVSLNGQSPIAPILTAVGAEPDFAPDVIVIDTFARSFVGLDENSSRDTGQWIKSAEELRSRGYTVIFLHHTRKNTEYGHQFRGSTAVSGAMDTIITVVLDKKSKTVDVEVTKQKDHEEMVPMCFKPKTVSPPNMEPSAVLEFQPGSPRLRDKVIKEINNEKTLTHSEKVKALMERLGCNENTAKSHITRLRKRIKEAQQADLDVTLDVAEAS